MLNQSPAPYLAKLNEAQRQAVLTTEGPLLILAGAGAGKTRVISHRIVHLIHQGVAPHEILAVTFTNKAAKEMRERILALIKDYPPTNRALYDSTPTVATFHALGVSLMREWHDHLNLPKYFTIFDRSDSLRAIKLALEAANLNPKDYEPRTQLSRISKLKGAGTTPAEAAAQATDYGAEITARVYHHYETLLRQDKAGDFDDLLLKPYELLRDHPDVRTALQVRYRYIHIDEYQDTNRLQLKFATLLAGERPNLCVVGDIDQNIYSWRGADIKNVLQFERLFPGANTILLEENYRSTKTIITASNQVIEKNRARVAKHVFTNNPTGEKITLYAALNGGDEADYIARTALKLRTVDPTASIAVLYRTNFQSRSLEEACLNYGLSYQLVGTKFFERKEVKDLLSYLRLALNPNSQSDLARIINEPSRGIGKVTLLKILSGERSSLTGAADRKVAGFETLLSEIRVHLKTHSLKDNLRFIMDKSGLSEHLRRAGTEEAESRLENLRELVSLAARYDDHPGETAALELLETAALQSDQDEIADTLNDQVTPVRLMTVHAAKGLEFDTVFIAGLEAGLFPHERLDDGEIDTEEERRLFYVALTRAAKKVHLSYAHLRTIYGTERVNLPSPFLNDISANLVERAEPDGLLNSGYETTIYLD